MSQPLTIGSLFSGIGGLELGLEWAGVGHTVWQVEQDEYCRAVLAKHWPHATRYEDVRNVGRSNLEPVDVICGGFPCQDISLAGKGAGLAGERSGLWFEYARIVRELRPRYVVVENVAALLGRGMGVVLGCLAELGYDAEWSRIAAADVGAPHGRERIFIVAHAQRERPATRTPRDRGTAKGHGVPHRERECASGAGGRAFFEPRTGGAAAAHRGGAGGTGLVAGANPCATRPRWLRGPEDLQCIIDAPFEPGDRWPQPLVRRVDDGLSARVDRLRALGNAVVPQVAEVVGRVILALEAERLASEAA